MNCGGYRNSCGPRLMPYGKGIPSSYCSDPKYNCMGPCSGKKTFNVHVQEPIYTYAPGSQGGEGDKKEPPCDPSPLPPINVNVKMCPKGSEFGPSGSCEEIGRPVQPFYTPPTNTASTTVAPCCAGGECLACDYTPRKPRCVDMHYVERTESLKPEIIYKGIPYKLDDRTTYRDFFHLKPRQARTLPCVPVSKLMQTSGKLQHFSEYKYSYVPFPTIPYAKPLWAKQEEFKGIEGELSGVTTYKTDYQRVVGMPAKSSKPRFLIDPNRGPLEDRTTYKVDFPAHPKCRERAMSTKPDPILFVPTVGAPFDGQTMYKTDFMSPCMTTAKSYKPTRRGNLPDGKFVDDTTYRDSYLPFTYMKCTPIENRTCFPFEERDMEAKEYGSSVW